MNSLIRWTPVGEMNPWGTWERFIDWDWEDVFEDFLKPSEGEKIIAWAPKIDSYRKNGSYVIKADLPGVEAKDIHVTLENGCLTIKGERKMDQAVKDKNREREEVFYGSFERTMTVPEGLKTEEIKATYHDGVLEITAPVEEKVLAKKIEVKEGKA